MTYLLQVSICWIVFYGIYLLFLRKETFFTINRYYLLGALVAGLGIPFLGGFLPANETSTEIYTVMSQVTAVEITPLQKQQEPIFTLANVLYMIYILGACVVFSRFLYGLSKIFKIYHGAAKTNYEKYTLVESDQFHLPFSFFHFIFISKALPLNKDVEQILKHEELHAHQWHSLDIVFIELLQVFFWFNPILIFYKTALKQSHEFLADAYVTRDHNRSSYGQLLLRQSTSGLEIALANHFFHSQIKNRITMMYKEKSKRPAMVKYLAALPVLVAMLFIFSSSKSNDKIEAPHTDGCLSIKIEDHDRYSMNDKPLSLEEFAQIVKGDQAPKCIDLNFNHSTFINSADPILEIASAADIGVSLNNDEKGADRLKSVFGEERSKISKDLNFNGRKIIHRDWKTLFSGKIKIQGIITVLAEANSNGDITYAEINYEKTTIENKDILKNALRATKGYKIEKGTGTAKGELIWDLNIPTPSPNYIYDEDKQEFKIKGAEKQGDPIYNVVEEMPRFPGCEEMEGSAKEKEECAKGKMLEFIYQNLKYPATARDLGVQGMTVVQFIIEKDGTISDAKIVRDIGAGCGEESLKIVNSMPTWIPGKQRGKKVRVQYTLPVKFKLEDKEISDEQKDFMLNVKAFGKSSEKAKEENLVIESSSHTTGAFSEEEVYMVVSEMPRFPGCEDMVGSTKEKEECAKGKLLEFIYTNLKYPKEAREKGIDGIVVVEMIIEKDGSVTSSKILRNPGAGTGTEAKRVVDAMPKWIPGKQKGECVRVRYVLPIKYKLEGDDDNSKKSKITNGVISITKEDFMGLKDIKPLLTKAGLSDECEVKGYRLVHVEPKKDATVSVNESALFETFAQKQIAAANVGDRYFFEDVYCQCPNDSDAKNKGGIVVKIIEGKPKTKDIPVIDKSKKTKLVKSKSTLKISREKFISINNIQNILGAINCEKDCKVASYKMAYIPTGSTAWVTQILKSEKFDAATQKHIKKAQVGDRYFFEDIFQQCPNDKEPQQFGAIAIQIIDASEEIAKEVDRKPLFPGTTTENESTQKMLAFVYQNIMYPKEAAQNNIEGTAIAKFIVNSKGAIEDIRITKSPGWGIDNAMSEMMNNMRKLRFPWTPALAGKDRVSYEYVLPVKFKLEDKQIEEVKNRNLDIQNLKIKPNPSNGIFTLDFELEDKAPVDIKFHTMNGQLIKTLNGERVPFSKSIDLTEYQGQTIFMNIIQKEKVFSEKIIIQ